MKYYFVWVLVSFISMNLLIWIDHKFSVKATPMIYILLVVIGSFIPFLNIALGIVGSFLCLLALIVFSGVTYDKYKHVTLNDVITKVKNTTKKSKEQR